jgi:hypothetical protein
MRSALCVYARACVREKEKGWLTQADTNIVSTVQPQKYSLFLQHKKK